jgi:formate dehydrogenase major subunit
VAHDRAHDRAHDQDDDPGLDPGRLRVGPPEHRAAGAAAVVASGRMALAQMGVARTARTLLQVNQQDGFDCPGCAWPDPDHRSPFEFCENGAKAVAEEATTRRVTRALFAHHSVDELRAHSDHWLGQQGRLTEPMWLAPGADRYEPISWDAAFGLVARTLADLDHPDQAAFYTSGRTSNEAAFVYQLFVRALGTNNLPDCSNMCHESSGAALTETIGVGKGSVTLEDLHQADLIVVVGQNPGTNHPRMLSALEQAKRNGARILAINPLPEAGLMAFANPQKARGLIGRGTPLADLFLQVRLNGDLALFQALNRLVLEADTRGRGAVDHAFVAEHCDGFDDLARHLARTDWPELLEATGLDRAQIDQAAELVLGSSRTIVCWAMGLTQHRNAVATIREIVNLLLLRGSIGRPGAGVCPVRGHSNVQGDRTMGIWEKPPPALLEALHHEFGFDPPTNDGLDVVDTIRAMVAGRVRVLVALGGNFVSATPDTAVTEAALAGCELTVHVSTKLNRSHLHPGRQALILPCLGRTEIDRQRTGQQLVSVEDSMSMVHASRGRLAPASADLLSEVSIVCRLARRTLGDDPSLPWEAFEDDYATIRDRIARVIPGFEDYNRRLDQPGGFLLPHPPRDERRFPTPSGRAQLSVNQLDVLRVPPGRLLMQTIRSHDQYNTTIYGLDDRYRGIHQGRRVVLVNPDDLADLGLVEAQVVDLVSEHQGVERWASEFRVVAYPTARGCCATYFPETNVLVALDSTAEISNTPTSKSLQVRLVAHTPIKSRKLPE